VTATAGLGGGNFASSMANISFFYPNRMKGWALGLNAAGGNIGVSGVQLRRRS
jgi:NNP family nitrate/nitrite transporter-like MFS transporter